MSSNYSSLPFELNEDLWFDDGDISVCARRFDSGALCLHKLYRDMLTVRFTTLLKLLDKCLARCDIYVGNTPYAYLPDDDALDLERFFIAICYPTYVTSFLHSIRIAYVTLKIFFLLEAQRQEFYPRVTRIQDCVEVQSEQRDRGACIST